MEAIYRIFCIMTTDTMAESYYDHYFTFTNITEKGLYFLLKNISKFFLLFSPKSSEVIENLSKLTKVFGNHRNIFGRLRNFSVDFRKIADIFKLKKTSFVCIMISKKNSHDFRPFPMISYNFQRSR